VNLTPAITLSEAMRDPNLFGKIFAGQSFWTWRTLAKVIDGIPLGEEREKDLFRECTGFDYDADRHRRRAQRLIVLVGRRGGKDRFFSAVAIWRAALFCDWRKFTSAGEGAVCLLVGGDKKHANILSRYCRGFFDKAPMLAGEVTRSTTDLIEFRNGASLEITANNATLVRGRSAIGIFASEISFWQTSKHAASSDEEVIAAALPSLAMCADGGLLAAWSSVHRKRGYSWRKYKASFGKPESEDLVWFAPSSVMNPSLPKRVVDEAISEDGARGRSEFLNVWRSDLEGFVSYETVMACVAVGIHERPPQRNCNYFAFVDPSGGSVDGMTMAIAHFDYTTQTIVIDVQRERMPPFSSEAVVRDFSEVLKKYGVGMVVGDKYAGEWPREQFRNVGIAYDAAVPTKSLLYEDLMSTLNSKRISLLDHHKTVGQIASLERRVGHSTRATIDHPPGAGHHDDCANAVAGVASLGLANSGYDSNYRSFLSDDDDTVDPAELARIERARMGKPWHPQYDCFAAPATGVPWDVRVQQEQKQAREKQLVDEILATEAARR
jgi:hypothetical protein